MFGRRARKITPVIEMTRKDWNGQIVTVWFADGIVATREQLGFWHNKSWETTALPMPHYNIVHAL